MFEIKFSDKADFPGRGHCIEMQGDWVTERVWKVVNHLVNFNRMDSVEYKARNGFQVFFQSGHDNPRGKYILLEFWVDDLSKTDHFVQLLNQAVNNSLAPFMTVMNINPYKVGYEDACGAYTVISMIEKEVGVRSDWGDSFTPIKFFPEDNVQYTKTLKLCNEFKVPVARYKDIWED